MNSDEKWLRERNRRFGVGKKKPVNSVPCIYRGKRYESLTDAAVAASEKIEAVRALAKRLSK